MKSFNGSTPGQATLAKKLIFSMAPLFGGIGKGISSDNRSSYLFAMGILADVKFGEQSPNIIDEVPLQWWSHTWYLSILLPRHTIQACKKYTKKSVNSQQNSQNRPKGVKIGQYLTFFCKQKSTPAWKSTPPPVVTVVTNISCGWGVHCSYPDAVEKRGLPLPTRGHLHQWSSRPPN